MTRRRALPCRLALACCVLLAPTLHAQQAPMDFEAAKAAADADESSQGATARAAASDRQRVFLDEAIAACADARNTADLQDFVVVVRLDEGGRVAQTWRRGDSPLALCVERHARGKVMFVPPRAPFHASLEVSFVPG